MGGLVPQRSDGVLPENERKISGGDFLRLLSYLVGVIMGGYLAYNVLHPYTLGVLVDVITIVLWAIANNNVR